MIGGILALLALLIIPFVVAGRIEMINWIKRHLAAAWVAYVAGAVLTAQYWEEPY